MTDITTPAEMREAAARLIDDRCADILSKQDGKIPEVDQNLRIMAAILPDIAAMIRALPVAEPNAQCCMCGKTGLSTAEDGGPECELSDGRWVCSGECYDLAVPVAVPLVDEAKRAEINQRFGIGTGKLVPVAEPERPAEDLLAKLETLANQAENIFKNCLVASGTCCCGEDMSHHSQYSGHSPTDLGEYQVHLWLKDLATIKGTTK